MTHLSVGARLGETSAERFDFDERECESLVLNFSREQAPRLLKIVLKNILLLLIVLIKSTDEKLKD
jgi:hypothetical protein